MKAFALLSSLCLLAFFSYGQIHYTNELQYVVANEAMVRSFFGTKDITNNVTKAEAIRVIPWLRQVTTEEDAARILLTNSLKNPLRIGTTNGWSSAYPLTDGTCLHLNYRGKPAEGGNWGGKGELQRAFIHSGEFTIFSITLTNAP